MDAWDGMFGFSTQHLMDQLKVHIARKSWVRPLNFILRTSLSSGGVDYMSVSGELIFSLGSTDGDNECVDIGIVKDDAVEVTEFFTFALFCTDSAVETFVPAADVYIVDEDGKFTFHDKGYLNFSVLWLYTL